MAAPATTVCTHDVGQNGWPGHRLCTLLVYVWRGKHSGGSPPRVVVSFFIVYTSSFNILLNTMASYPSFNNVLSNTMADAIDLDDYSASESEFEPEGNVESTNNDSDTVNNSNDSESGALSPEESTRELNAIRKDKGKERARPSGLHIITGCGLQYIRSSVSVRPSDTDNRINSPSYPTSSRLSRSGTGVIGDPPPFSQSTVAWIEHGTAGKSQEGCPR